MVVEAIYGSWSARSASRGATTCARPTVNERSASAPTGGWPSSSVRRRPTGPVSSGLRRADASVVEPAAVSWHALRLAGTGPARGSRSSAPARSACWPWPAPAGWARRRSRSRPATPTRRRPASASGARSAPTGVYDVVVEAAGTEASLARCGELVAPGGTIVVLGVHFGPVQLDWMPLFHKEARVIPSLGYCAHDGGREMEDAAAMLADDPDIARTLITHRFPIEDAAEAFRVASERASGARPRGDRAVVKSCGSIPVGSSCNDLDAALTELSALFGHEWCPSRRQHAGRAP